MNNEIIVPFKVNLHETHDRLGYLKRTQSTNVFDGVEYCLKKNPLSLAIQEKSPYVYIFAHARTHDNGIDKVLYWNPRLSIPEAQTNSYLFRVPSHSDNVLICWMIPQKEQWKQYEKGNITEHEIVLWSINQYKKDKKSLEKPHPDDLPEESTKKILKQIIDEHDWDIKFKKAISYV